MPRDLHSRLYDRIREVLSTRREAVGLSQEALAKRLGRTQSFVSKYEGGERYLDVVEFIEVCDGLGIKPDKAMRDVVRDWRVQ